MSSAVAGYKLTLGADAPPACYEDLDHARTLFISGSNMAWAHPILMRRLEDARRARPETKWIVVDPRRTETAAMADLHLQIQPGTDITLCHGIAHLLLWEGLTDRGLHRRAHARASTPCATSCATTRRARWRRPAASRKPTWCRRRAGSAASSTAPGGAGHAVAVLPGPEPERQRHAQQRRADQPASAHRPDRQAGRRPVLADRPAQRDGWARGRRAGQPARRAPRPRQCRSTAPRWRRCGACPICRRSPASRRSRCSRPRPTVRSSCCGSPARTRRSRCRTSRTVRRALERCEFVIVQEAFRTTATCAFADLLLPASTWGEKEGSVTNSERRISRVRAAVRGARRGACRLAHRRRRGAAARGAPARGRAPTVAASGFAFASPEAAWNEHREATRGRDLDITGLSYAMLECARSAAVAAARAARPAAASACTKTAASCSTMAARASLP